MEVALTFGSVGDIPAICQIAIELSRALGSSAGSAKEYLELRTDLDSFVRVLMQVIGTYEQHQVSPWLKSVESEIKHVVADCGKLVQDALDHFLPKYHSHLRSGGSGNIFKDALKKVEWNFSEMANLQRLSGKMKTYTERISLLIGIAARTSARVDNGTMLARIREVTESLQTQTRTSGTVLSLARDTYLAVLEIKGMIGNVCQIVVHLQSLASNSIFFRALDPTRDMPVLFEDALGNVIPIPMTWIHDWSGFNGLLEHRFEKLKGHDMVARGEYALEESCTGKDIDRTHPWSASFRRGMKVNMSMVFTNIAMVRGCCPRCETVADALENVTIRCTNKECGMWFRMLKKGVEERSGIDMNDQQHEEIEAVMEQVTDFQRVRLIMTEPFLNSSPTNPISRPALWQCVRLNLAKA
ncbi:hypothetical protein BKA56DRAFT_635546 [Ilyonectria sp. MPI-CAGE-AT-0026]|nr:hypothetical protein BKA56DRAFT_635546 [Ilyonectria sp. MPI-CAGE-AT-0026]